MKICNLSNEQKCRIISNNTGMPYDKVIQIMKLGFYDGLLKGVTIGVMLFLIVLFIIATI